VMGKQNYIPQNWAIPLLQDVADINPTFDKSSFKDDLKVSFVPMPAVEAETGRIDVSQTRKFGEVKKGYTPFQKKDVLFAKITPCMENGKMAVVPDLHNNIGFGSTEFHVLRSYQGIEPNFLYYFVSSKSFRYDAEHNMTGAVGQKRVPTPYFGKCSIPLPPTNEQKRIVAKIEELFSELDKGIENLKIAREQLKIYRQAVLKHAFAGRLTARWREQNKDKLESAGRLLERIKSERDAEYRSKLDEWEAALKKGDDISKPRKPRELRDFSEEDFSWLPGLPNEWMWERLGWMTCGVEYGTAAKSSESGKVPVLRMGNIQNMKFDWSDLVYTSDTEEITKYSLKEGDVLFNRTNSPELVGKTAIYKGERPAVFAGYLIRINQIQRIVDSRYLNFYLNSYATKQYGNRVKTDGVNQSNINGERLAHYPFPYCSCEEQKVIVSILEEQLSLVDQMEADIALELQKSEAMRQSILKKAFSGKLVAQDPNDEPASVLLERIRAEKEAQNTESKKPKAKKEAA
jgi:type I restriction enzyme, S subunit